MPTYYVIFLMQYIAKSTGLAGTRSSYLVSCEHWMEALGHSGTVWSRPIKGTHKSREKLYLYDSGLIVWTNPNLDEIVKQGVDYARNEIISLGFPHLAYWADEHPNRSK
jgi:hypothetical protein